MTVIVGANDFFGVPFPLVLADRFFNIYEKRGVYTKKVRLGLNIFRWDEKRKQAIYEVIDDKANMDNIETNPTGIVTFSSPETGAFLYKFRPKPGVSQIFGKVPMDNEFEVRINDKRIAVMVGEKEMGTIARNQISGVPIGIRIGADGSVGIGVTRLPEGMEIERG